jgi:hypothetical protein
MGGHGDEEPPAELFVTGLVGLGLIVLGSLWHDEVGEDVSVIGLLLTLLAALVFSARLVLRSIQEPDPRGVPGQAVRPGLPRGGPGEESFALWGGGWVLVRSDALVVEHMIRRRVPYRAIRDIRANTGRTGLLGCTVICLTTTLPIVLPFPDRATRYRFLAALRARLVRTGSDGA